jgi:hypothetical protein
MLKYVPGRGLQFCDIRFLEKQRRIEVERGRHLLICADDAYVLGENSVPSRKHRIPTTCYYGSRFKNKHRENKVYIFVSRHRNKGQSHYIRIANKFFENAAKLK